MVSLGICDNECDNDVEVKIGQNVFDLWWKNQTGSLLMFFMAIENSFYPLKTLDISTKWPPVTPTWDSADWVECCGTDTQSFPSKLLQRICSGLLSIKIVHHVDENVSDRWTIWSILKNVLAVAPKLESIYLDLGEEPCSHFMDGKRLDMLVPLFPTHEGTCRKQGVFPFNPSTTSKDASDAFPERLCDLPQRQLG